jgi:signal transduction histidine kinase
VSGAHDRLYVDVADNVPEGVLAETSLDRVLFNLLTNAVRFSSPASEVRLTVSHTTPVSNNIPHKVGKFQGPEGVTFAIRNSTTQAVDVAEIDKYIYMYIYDLLL